MHDLKPNQKVPEGVDAQSWLGFEHRIGQRRLAVLARAIDVATATGDLASAQSALEEARALCPDAPELLRLEATVAAMTPANDARLWTRAAGAMALLILGVSMVIGLESLRRVVDTPDTQAGNVLRAPAAEGMLPALSAKGGLGAPVALSPLSAAGGPDEEIDVAANVEPQPEPQPQLVVASSRSVEPAIAVERSRSTEPERTTNAARLIEPARSTPPPSVPSRTPIRPGAAIPPPASAASRIIQPPESTTRQVAREPEAPVGLPQLAPPEARTVEATPKPASGYGTRPPLTAPTDATSEDQSRVADVLRRYARAYGALDANAAREIWPSVDQRALARAFDSLRSQELSLQDCEIDVHGTTANASCRGQAQYVGKVGNGAPRIEPRMWRFQLRLEGEAWKIANAEARRPTS